MIIYADTSALVKLLLQEQGTSEMQAMSDDAERTISAAIAYVELYAAVAAAIRAGRVPRAMVEPRILELERVWSEVVEIAVDGPLLRRAAGLAREACLRAYDAVHLAALLASGEADEVTFACWDTDLRLAARDLGYRLFPALLA